jgi:hypothetical protein
MSQCRPDVLQGALRSGNQGKAETRLPLVVRLTKGGRPALVVTAPRARITRTNPGRCCPCTGR